MGGGEHAGLDRELLDSKSFNLPTVDEEEKKLSLKIDAVLPLICGVDHRIIYTSTLQASRGKGMRSTSRFFSGMSFLSLSSEHAG
eukprot:656957-Amphidinium_carterae.1